VDEYAYNQPKDSFSSSLDGNPDVQFFMISNLPSFDHYGQKSTIARSIRFPAKPSIIFVVR